MLDEYSDLLTPGGRDSAQLTYAQDVQDSEVLLQQKPKASAGKKKES